MELNRLVEVTETLRATRSRTAKVSALAEVLRATAPTDAEATVGLLVGRIRQGRIGLGWRTLASAADASPPADGATLTVAAVDAALGEIAGLGGPGSATARTDAVRALLARATAAERDFLRGALLGDVRTGALDGILTDALATAVRMPLADVRRAVMLTGSLGGVAAAALADPQSLGAAAMAVGTPVQPMLASTAADVAAALEVTGEASVEHKLDGARIQVHRRGEEVSVFTRSLADITGRVPEIVSVVRGFPCESVILDGETLALDEDGAPRPFQETMSRFGAEEEREQVLAPRFFDVLHVDGRDLIDEPLSVRLQVLERVALGHRVEGAVTDDPQVAARVLEEALAVGQEGVVVKAISSPYAAGRRGKHWVKVKPVHTFDLVVLGAEWGYGRRQGWLSNLHLGALDPEGSFGPAGGFVMVGKTFKGLTDELLRWQTATFPGYESSRTPGVIHLRPELVVEIAIDGVQRSPRYPGGLALRFARVKGYRPDKTPAEADTVASLQAHLRT